MAEGCPSCETVKPKVDALAAKGEVEVKVLKPDMSNATKEDQKALKAAPEVCDDDGCGIAVPACVVKEGKNWKKCDTEPWA